VVIFATQYIDRFPMEIVRTASALNVLILRLGFIIVLLICIAVGYKDRLASSDLATTFGAVVAVVADYFLTKVILPAKLKL
jgi:hypothetical protein